MFFYVGLRQMERVVARDFAFVADHPKVGRSSLEGLGCKV
jgi:hypothetical protein